ncbi:MAG: nitroreductase family protein [Desulfovibrio sp.]|nr:nitroreductase family protein [Desulfovibrio sp.]
MQRFFVVGFLLSVILCVSFLPSAASADGQIVQLPAPDMQGGRPLLACLKDRHSDHHPGGEDFTLPQLSTLLWSAWGINRPDGRHVIPTARNQQKIRLYAVLSDGVWQYLPERTSIQKVLDGDMRKRFDNATMIFLYAAPAGDIFSAMHVGSMYQNVALYCASEGFANCVKQASRDALDKELSLPKGYKVLITQSIGHHSLK